MSANVEQHGVHEEVGVRLKTVERQSSYFAASFVLKEERKPDGDELRRWARLIEHSQDDAQARGRQPANNIIRIRGLANADVGATLLLGLLQTKTSQ